jgi:hypothetical protein
MNLKAQQRWHQVDSSDGLDYNCAYCGHKVAASQRYRAVAPTGHVNNAPTVSTIEICPHCANPTYFQQREKQFPSPAFGRTVRNISEPKIQALYEESRVCTAQGAFTASVMLCRKLIMNIAVHQGAAANLSFVAYVDYLGSKGFVPPNGKKWVDEIRQKGNEANHEIELMTAKDAERSITFIENLLRFIFELPSI